MEKLQISDRVKRILSVTTVFILTSTLIVIFMGWSSSRINSDIKKLNIFLSKSENIQANFEKSLQMYTESTEKIIDYLLTLRPSNEEQYILFISQVEDIGKRLSLSINLQSVVAQEGSEGFEANTLLYDISFFGTQFSLSKFLYELEKLPYFIKIEKIKYTNPKDIKENGNIDIAIKLFTK